MELERPARFAYADPPYPSTARRYYGDDPRCAEVNHAILVGSLCMHYPDGWALSTGSRHLQHVLSLCPDGVRIGVWHRPNARRGNARERTWEPVIFCGGRHRHDYRVDDLVQANAPGVPGFVGAKPIEFAWWVFCMLGARPEDELDDLFPGTGAITRAWRAFALQPVTEGLRYAAGSNGSRR